MESGTSPMSQEFVFSNSTVPRTTENSATQIFLLKEEVPNSGKKDDKKMGSNFLKQSENQQFLRVANSSTVNLSPVSTGRSSTTVINEASQNELSIKVLDDRDVTRKKKQKRSNKKVVSDNSDGPYTCDKCKKSFTHESSLKAHVRRTYCQEAKSLVSRTN